MARERKYQPAAEDQRDYPEDFQTVLNGGGSRLHEHFGKWVAEKTNAAGHFKTAKELSAFELGARFGIRYRMDHQSALDGAHAFHEEDRAAREAEQADKAKARQERAAAKAAEAPPAKPATRGRKAAAAVEEPPAKPARRTRAAAAEKPAPAAKATASRPAAKAAATPARRPAASTKPTRAARRPAKAAEAEF